LDEGKSSLREVIVQETYLFMAVTVQVEYDKSDTLKGTGTHSDRSTYPFTGTL
jgi:hypothetical protein